MPAPLEDTMSWPEICDHVLTKITIPANEVKRFKEWFMEREKVGYLIDPLMIKRCFVISKELNDNHDHFIVISGREGDGKSTFAFQIAAWINPNFNFDNIVYGAHDYVDILKKRANEIKDLSSREVPTESIVLDEGTELLSKETLSLTNKVFTKTFFIQRALRYLIIICIPNFFMLDQIVRVHRCRTLVHVIKRGSYKCIVGRGIAKVAKEGMIHKNVNAVPLPDGFWWTGSFRKPLPRTLEVGKYEESKLKGIRRALENLSEDVVSRKLTATTKVAKEIGVKPDTVVKMVKNGELEGKQIGGRWYITRKAYDKLITP